MNEFKTLFKHFFVSILITLCFFGCSPTIATYDQYAYTQTTSLKVDVLNVMDKATDAYTNHSAEVDDVNTKLMKNIEYEKHRDKNQVTIDMYNILSKLLNDPKTITIGPDTFKHGFFEEWKRRGKLLLKNGNPDTAFVNHAKNQIGEGFDYIAELESKKIKPSDSGVQNFISQNK